MSGFKTIELSQARYKVPVPTLALTGANDRRPLGKRSQAWLKAVTVPDQKTSCACGRELITSAGK